MPLARGVDNKILSVMIIVPILAIITVLVWMAILFQPFNPVENVKEELEEEMWSPGYIKEISDMCLDANRKFTERIIELYKIVPPEPPLSEVEMNEKYYL